jgi:hypothetical protein
MNDHKPTQLEIMALFASHPKLIIEALSIYYPFLPSALLKYSDIIHWGQRNSFDYDDGPITRTHTFWFSGIIFNKAISWDDLTRTIVASNLAIRGGELGFINWEWDEHKEGGRSRGLLLNSCKDTLDITARCPLSTSGLGESKSGLYYSEPKFGEITEFDDEPISWPELKSQFEEKALPELILHPDIWHKTLEPLLTESMVEELMNTFYWQHLNQKRSKYLTWNDPDYI